MIVGQKPQRVSANYEDNIMYEFADQFLSLSNAIVQEANGADLVYDPRRVLASNIGNETLKNYFVSESCDEEHMTAREIEEHVENMSALYDNDRDGLLEAASMVEMNPIMGMTFPMHKWILMNMVFDKGGIQKVVTQSPSFTIVQEERYLVDTEGNELNMFKDQNKLTDAIEATAALKTFDITDLPLTEATEIVHDKLGGLAGADHLSIETNLYAVLVKDVYFEEGDILPNENGYIEKNGKIATADEAGNYDVWVRVKVPFQPGYTGHLSEESRYDRALVFPFVYRYKAQGADGAEVTEIRDTITGTIRKDRITLNSTDGLISGVRIQARIDTSNARQTTCEVKWRPVTKLEEIPNAIPINTTITPEEIKDINALYNVNQVTKIMYQMKSVLANYKDDKILRALNDSYATLDDVSSSYSQFDFAPRTGYYGDHVQWRRDTFLDWLDSDVTKLMQALNDPNMTVTIFGDPDLVRKITPTNYTFQSPSSIGPVDIDFTKTVYTSDKRVYNFIGSDKLRNTTEFIIVLKPNGTDRILYRIYDYQMYLSNEIRNANNPALPALHAFERFKFVEYTPVQGRINILHPRGINQETYNAFPVNNITPTP